MVGGLLGAALLICGAGHARAEDPPEPAALAVRLLSPQDRGFVAGATPIEAEVDVPAGIHLSHVDFEVDGRVIATLSTPPWRIVEDFGGRIWFTTRTGTGTTFHVKLPASPEAT